MAWNQRSLFTGVLAEFAEVQSRWGDADKVVAFESIVRATRLATNTRAVAKWNEKHAEERRARQRIYDARKNAKKRAA